MLFRALRFAIAAGLALAVWTIASPAWAAPAPYCDDRGASAIAPPPALEAPDVAVQRARLEPTCNGEERLFDPSVTRSHEGRTMTAEAPEPGVPTTMVAIPPATGTEMDAPPEVHRPSSGIRSRVERPPRG